MLTSAVKIEAENLPSYTDVGSLDNPYTLDKNSYFEQFGPYTSFEDPSKDSKGKSKWTEAQWDAIREFVQFKKHWESSAKHYNQIIMLRRLRD